MKETDPELVPYIEAPTLEFENTSTWAGIVVTHMWMLYMTVSQPVDDRSIYEGQSFGSKGGGRPCP